MNSEILKKLEKKLQQQKESIEKELKSFAKEDVKPRGDWNTRYPKFNGGDLEEEADEFQEYEKLLSIEHALELKLRDINLALEKIKKNKYGKCGKCGKSIDIARLKACPEAKLCTKCK
ncbi:TraR/DksA C4-type zinc finger protein [Patescibacteria group bacterium]|nr:TraR/DksA C4-type zinc finger protein [Patescibacteria group bacterium]MBU4274340.1 TraR/DksA C4-type zinc finger protein [Patescibacteria group bacterium]MBU4367552.1 TraR/DksA C4-type zinc finger protein [Patescibacteria group bacterium]MBU4461593.1 TraR/DksA C4-type zinc finger protein [Patescibacteria group bacterium]MCG2699490.1 TraR/DksA C4-type zinc finger protein [Candidatus Parcubacteria bacterium]